MFDIFPVQPPTPDITTVVATDVVTDLSAFFGQAAGAATDLSPVAACFYLLYLTGRMLLPVVLIVYASRTATPEQRIGLVRSYLNHTLRADRTAQWNSSAGTSPPASTVAQTD